MLFRHALPEERFAVLALYEEAKSEPFCVWNEVYPAMQEIEHDLETENLYVLVENDVLIGALSVVPENEMDDYPHWKLDENAREIARVVVAKPYQNKGYAAYMMNEILEALGEDVYFAVHISVAEQNIPALKVYQKCGFSIVGEVDQYGNHYVLMEKIL